MTLSEASTRNGTRTEARKRRQRGNYLAVLGAVFAAAVLGAVVTGFLVMAQDLAAERHRGDLLAAQVESLGGTPVAGPTGSAGAAGLVGPSGPAGPSGASGQPGKAAPTLTPSPGPTGPAGPSGAPGADSTVPGPTGSAGQNGADGASGAPGKDGTDGSNGSPPSSWTFTDQNGVEYQCVPVDNFDPDNPRYQCTPTSTASADPSPTPSQEPSPTDTTSSGLLPLNLLNRRTSSGRSARPHV